MTAFWRTLILIVVGLGAGWAATRIGSGPPTIYDALDEPAAGEEPVADEPVANEPGADELPAEADAPDAAEVEAQIRRAEAALGDRADPDRELPVDPLRADVAIALPSDI